MLPLEGLMMLLRGELAVQRVGCCKRARLPFFMFQLPETMWSQPLLHPFYDPFVSCGPYGHFYSLATINSAAIKMGVQVLL
jgi:hypothetical protein